MKSIFGDRPGVYRPEDIHASQYLNCSIPAGARLLTQAHQQSAVYPAVGASALRPRNYRSAAPRIRSPASRPYPIVLAIPINRINVLTHPARDMPDAFGRYMA